MKPHFKGKLNCTTGDQAEQGVVKDYEFKNVYKSAAGDHTKPPREKKDQEGDEEHKGDKREFKGDRENKGGDYKKKF